MFERAELGFIRHFHSITFCSLKPKSLINQLIFSTKCNIGEMGGQKSAKNFEEP